jgi:hypothetical protein
MATLDLAPSLTDMFDMVGGVDRLIDIRHPAF